MKKITLVFFALLATLGTKAMETKTLTISGTDLNHVSGNKFTYAVEGEGTFSISGNADLKYETSTYMNGNTPSLHLYNGSYSVSWAPDNLKKIKVTSIEFIGNSNACMYYVQFDGGDRHNWAGTVGNYSASANELALWDGISFSASKWFGVNQGIYIREITINYELYTGLALDETESYDVNLNGSFDFVTLNRSLKTTWSTFCLPISLTSEQITAMFGSDAEVAKLTGTTGTELQFSTDFRSIEANEPCLIKLAEAGSTFTLNESVTVSPVGNTPQFTRGAATLVGNYATQYVPEGSYFVSANMFYQAGFETTNMKGFRAYITFDEGTAAAPAKTLVVAVDNNTTAIDGINADKATNAGGNIYTLGGQLVRKNATSTEGLAKGIYLVNGKKVLVR